MDKPTHSHQVKKSQQRNLLIVGGVILLVCLGLYYSLDSDHAEHKPKDKVEKVNLASPLNHVDAQSIWVERAQNQLAQATKAQGALKQQLQLLQQGKENQDKTVQTQAQQIQALQMQLNLLQQKVAQQKPAAYTGSQFPPAPGSEDNHQNQSDGFISDVTLRLTPRPSKADLIPARNPDTFVPAGTFVRAITLEGADASAGVTSQGDPSPMLFRVLDQGTLPNHQKSHLKNCVATAAAIGDISSERGQIRLERLSCTKDDGQIVEIPVEATVAGPDGKNGVRGNALWREGALLERAFVAGTLSGVSSGIAQSYTTTSLTPYGQMQTVNNGRIMQYGLANGVGNAAEKLADYNIKRAEQYHPVIQLSAGTVVDIVFLKGFYLDGKKHSEHEPDNEVAIDKNATPSFLATDATSGANPPVMGSPATLPLTPEQIQTLKQKNAQQGYH